MMRLTMPSTGGGGKKHCRGKETHPFGCGGWLNSAHEVASSRDLACRPDSGDAAGLCDDNFGSRDVAFGADSRSSLCNSQDPLAAAVEQGLQGQARPLEETGSLLGIQDQARPPEEAGSSLQR